jgi:hypothetical protein
MVTAPALFRVDMPGVATGCCNVNTSNDDIRTVMVTALGRQSASGNGAFCDPMRWGRPADGTEEIVVECLDWRASTGPRWPPARRCGRDLMARGLRVRDLGEDARVEVDPGLLPELADATGTKAVRAAGLVGEVMVTAFSSGALSRDAVRKPVRSCRY